MQILFIYSSTDGSSLDVMSRLSGIPELKRISIPVDAANPEINAILKASKDVIVSEVPTIINYGTPDGSILKYEGLQSVGEFIDEVEHNIAQHKKEEDGKVATPVITRLSDLGLEEEVVNEPYKPTVTSQTPHINPQNMPIKAKRGVAQNRKIEDFKAARETPSIAQGGDNSNPSRIKITSPPMRK